MDADRKWGYQALSRLERIMEEHAHALKRLYHLTASHPERLANAEALPEGPPAGPRPRVAECAIHGPRCPAGPR